MLKIFFIDFMDEMLNKYCMHKEACNKMPAQSLWSTPAWPCMFYTTACFYTIYRQCIYSSCYPNKSSNGSCPDPFPTSTKKLGMAMQDSISNSSSDDLPVYAVSRMNFFSDESISWEAQLANPKNVRCFDTYIFPIKTTLNC